MAASPPFSIDAWEQAQAASELLANTSDRFVVSLLDGVTGSGKTEVYFEAIAAALAAGRQALVLLPEIALSAQWLQRFRARFTSHTVVEGTFVRRKGDSEWIEQKSE